MKPSTDTYASNGDYARFILWPTDKINERGQLVSIVQEFQYEACWSTVTFSLPDSTDQARLEEITREIESNEALQEFFDEHDIFDWQFLPMNSQSVTIGVVYP